MKATLMEADEESLDEEDMVRAFQEEERIRKQALLEVMKEGDAKKSRRRQRDGSGQLIDLPPLSPEEQVFHQPPPRACADAQNRSGAREESIVTAPRGFRRPRSPRAWVPESPQPTPRGFRSPRNPRGVGSGVPAAHARGLRLPLNPHRVGSGVPGTHARGLRLPRNPHRVGSGVPGTHAPCAAWVRSRPPNPRGFGVSFSGAVLADGPRFLVF